MMIKFLGMKRKQNFRLKWILSWELQFSVWCRVVLFYELFPLLIIVVDKTYFWILNYRLVYMIVTQCFVNKRLIFILLEYLIDIKYLFFVF